MRKRNHSKAGLFLIELMISVLFFSVTAAFFMKVFVKSNEMRKESKIVFEAQLRVSSAAEMLKEGKEPEQIYYGADWRPCEKKDAQYILMVEEKKRDNLITYTIKMCSPKKDVIYQVKMSQWMGEQ